MRNIYKTYAMLAVAALLGAACAKEGKENQGQGCLSVTVETAQTRAQSESELLSSAVVKIYKSDFSGLVRSYAYNQMPAELMLPADSYRIDVTAGGCNTSPVTYASWDVKSYEGSEPVTVSAGKNTSVTVTAAISNAVTNISFDSSIAATFAEGYSCTIGLSADDAARQLVYTADKSGQDGYFLPEGFEPSLYWSFSGTLLKDGSTFTKSGTIAAVEKGKRYTISLKYTEKSGNIDLELVVDKSTDIIYDDIIFIPVSTGVAATGRFDIWAGHFTAYADVDESEYDASKVFFEYRKAGEESWTRKSAERQSEGFFSAVINGLSGSTEYEYRLVVTSLADGSESVIAANSNITTDVAPQVPNNGFETTSNAESSKYKSFYDPESLLPELQTKWWCSGNAGSTTVSSSHQICYPDTENFKEGTQSMKLHSRYVVIKFAAGNLFSGHFGSTIGTSGGTVYFGRPFTARPTAMRLWVKYSSGKVNRRESNAPDEIQTGDYDKALLRIALGTWDYKTYGGDANSPVLVNTTDTSTFVDYSTDESTIALGEVVMTADADNSTNVWQQMTIPLEYRNTNVYPTHIIISFAASYYGDYFTGYDDSQLWVDNVELLYE